VCCSCAHPGEVTRAGGAIEPANATSFEIACAE
jgi:hypothetical protein